MKILRISLIALVPLAFVSSTASADVKLTIQNGRVSIVAKDATVRQILAEWARVGQTNVVNVDKIPGGPQTIELTNVPEAEALDVLLRAVSGFIAAPRTTPAGATASQFDRIIVMPTTAAPRPSVSAGVPPPTFVPQPVAPVDDDTDDERPQAPVAVPPAAPRGPIFNQFPQPQVVNPQGASGAQPLPYNPAQPQYVQPQPPAQQPSAVPTAPFGGVAVPGMVAPAPPQPPGTWITQPQPNAPPGTAQPVRRPDGGREGI